MTDLIGCHGASTTTSRVHIDVAAERQLPGEMAAAVQAEKRRTALLAARGRILLAAVGVRD